MRVGFIGLGLMGSRMAENLAKAGIDLIVYNRTKEKCKPFESFSNVIISNSIKELAYESDVLFTMLSRPESVEETAFGADGFLDDLKENSIWIDCSTVNPAFSEKMFLECTKRNIAFIDAPVAGSTKPAENGELLFLVGGDEDKIETCLKYFDIMGKKTIHVGKQGKGTSLKMVINMMLGNAMLAFSEALSLGNSLDLPSEMLMDTLLNSPVTAPFIKGKIDKIKTGNFETEFPLELMEKDLELVSKTAYENGAFLPTVNVVKEVYTLAKKSGYGEKDFSAVSDLIMNEITR